jgi:hypothetical protein
MPIAGRSVPRYASCHFGRFRNRSEDHKTRVFEQIEERQEIEKRQVR